MAKGKKTIAYYDTEIAALEQKQKELKKARKEALMQARYMIGETVQAHFDSIPYDADEMDVFFANVAKLVQLHQSEFEAMFE